MSENKQLITPKIPIESYEFIQRAAKTIEFYNHNHVIEVALKDLQIKIEGDISKEKKEPIKEKELILKRITTAKRNKKVTEIPLSQSNMTQSKGLQWHMRHHTKHNRHGFR